MHAFISKDFSFVLVEEMRDLLESKENWNSSVDNVAEENDFSSPLNEVWPDFTTERSTSPEKQLKILRPQLGVSPSHDDGLAIAELERVSSPVLGLKPRDIVNIRHQLRRPHEQNDEECIDDGKVQVDEDW